MKRTDIERIIKQGSVRQKIKLYMTDIALVNVDLENFDYEITGKELNIKGSKLLSNKERELLWSSIKDPKDVKYYNELTKYNSAFLLFKDKLSVHLMTLQALFYHISIYNAEEIKRAESRDLVNEILDLIPDKKTREKVLNKAVELTKEDGGLSSTEGGKIYQEKGSPKYLDISRSGYWRDLKIPTEMAIKRAKLCKEFIALFKTILNNDLPLKPYIDWVDVQDKKLKKLIEAIYVSTVLEDTPPDFPIIERYEEIEAIITDEDIEDFKSSGL
jgi:hypothetical protein